MEPEDAVGAPRGVRLGIGAAIVVVIVVAAIVIAVAVWRGANAPVEVVDGAGTPSPSTGPVEQGDVAPSPDASGELYIHVFGAVEHPGLYVLPDGSRVVDAVFAAGGLRESAAPEGVNLARELADGEQIAVPTKEQVASGEVPTPAQPDGSGGGSESPIDLNAAGPTELEALPGIGPALAQRIIAWRDDNGPFGSVDDLLAVSGIGEKVLAGIRDLVRV